MTAPAPTAPPAPGPGDDPAIAAAVLAGPLLGGGALRQLARSLAADADTVRAQAARLAAGAAATGWRSTAADACRAHLAATGGELARTARALDGASDAVARHAAIAARRAEELVEAARRLLDVAAAAARGALGLAGAGVP